MAAIVSTAASLGQAALSAASGAADAREDAAERQARIDALAEDRRLDDRARTRALRRAIAGRRATSAAHGLEPADGSGEALLLGLVGDSAEEGRREHALYRRRLQSLLREASAARRRNLLDRAGAGLGLGSKLAGALFD